MTSDDCAKIKRDSNNCIPLTKHDFISLVPQNEFALVTFESDT